MGYINDANEWLRVQPDDDPLARIIAIDDFQIWEGRVPPRPIILQKSTGRRWNAAWK
jgi:hypothetical protein